MSGILAVRRGTVAPVPAPAGPGNIITNGSFTAGDTGWSGGGYSGKAITGGKARFTASPAYDGYTQAIAPTAGKYYELTWTISEYASGSVYPQLAGGTVRSGTARAANGTYTERLLVNTGNNLFVMQMDTGGTLAVDDITLVGPYNTATVGGA